MTSAASLSSAGDPPPRAPEGQGDTRAAETGQVRTSPSQAISVQVLVNLRSVLLAGQFTALMVVWKGLHWPVSGSGCLVLIGVSTALNILIALSPAVRRKGRSWEILGNLIFDILQLTGLLFLTGGVLNPFALMMIVPVTIAGGGLAHRETAVIVGLAIASILALTIFPNPPPWPSQGADGFYSAYRPLVAGGLILTTSFAAIYAAWTSGHRARNELALHIAETVLVREQRLSALGALAAAAAHELGTPLATIAVVAKEMARAAGEGPFKEDAWLLVEQAGRCRDILKRLAEKPEQSDIVHERMTLLELVREVVEPYVRAEDVRVEGVVTGPPNVAAPDLWRRNEVLHALAAVVENAYDFARGEILVTARFDAQTVIIEVKDDGPGFASHVLPKLGEPYITSRPGAEGSRTGHIGMGLGFFIAKTLLERTGARVDFRNGAKFGAIVNVQWPRGRIEAFEPRA